MFPSFPARGQRYAIRTFMLVCTLPLFGAAPAAPSVAPASEFYVTVQGSKQGKFKGEATRSKQADRIPATRFSYEIVSPRDLATGAATGKRQHKPIVITKPWGASSPQFFAALTSNETLTTVLLEFVDSNAAGVQEVVYTITLRNASVANIRSYAEAQSGQRELVPLEDISLVFQRIEVESKTGKTMSMDDIGS